MKREEERREKGGRVEYVADDQFYCDLLTGTRVGYLPLDHPECYLSSLPPPPLSLCLSPTAVC